MTLKADDGTPLETKEGIILDQEGQPLAHSGSRPLNSVRSFSFSLPLPGVVLGLLFIPIALATGLAFFGVIAFFLMIFFIVSRVSRFF